MAEVFFFSFSFILVELFIFVFIPTTVSPTNFAYSKLFSVRFFTCLFLLVLLLTCHVFASALSAKRLVQILQIVGKRAIYMYMSWHLGLGLWVKPQRMTMQQRNVARNKKNNKTHSQGYQNRTLRERHWII